ncbi:motility protein A [Rhizorhapis suberifaciens]|uniref:Chemotaxis protein MotA n=1 Tax=Rhizorhapis suberifaciens TaxID=13656 RepID=A0A840HWL4_9SPHN|nr:MotA/TolQ/ExbB proton channel family protein [Rhizorhapis suberifaciens]MBB4642455.1 chemotaxis protein MotA [Rhizorhapis suberifaciens]
MAEFLALMGRIFDPAAALLIFAGSLAIALVQMGPDNIRRLPRSFGPLLRARPRADRDAARHAMLRVEHVAHLKGLACTDRIAATGSFLKQAVDQLANARNVSDFERWATQELAARTERHDMMARTWNALADAAPALGMAGTIFGLIRMFAGMDDPATIGPAMAMALLTTLYGVILSNMVAGPFAARLALLSQMEISWQRDLIDRMVELARAEIPSSQPVARRPDVVRPRQNPVREAA